MNIDSSLLGRFHSLVRRSGHPLISEDERTALLELDKEHKRLCALHQKYHHGSWRKHREAAIDAFRTDPTDENAARIVALGHEEAYGMHIGTLATLISEAHKKFAREQVRPVVIPVFQRALELAQAEAAEVEQTERKQAERFEVDFAPSVTLSALRLMTQRLREQIECGEGGECKITPETALQLEPTQHETPAEQPAEVRAAPKVKTSRARAAAPEDPFA